MVSVKAAAGVQTSTDWQGDTRGGGGVCAQPAQRGSLHHLPSVHVACTRCLVPGIESYTPECPTLHTYPLQPPHPAPSGPPSALPCFNPPRSPPHRAPPCCGTMRKSPSALARHVSSMSRLAVYTWTANPSFMAVLRQGGGHGSESEANRSAGRGRAGRGRVPTLGGVPQAGTANVLVCLCLPVVAGVSLARQAGARTCAQTDKQAGRRLTGGADGWYPIGPAPSCKSLGISGTCARPPSLAAARKPSTASASRARLHGAPPPPRPLLPLPTCRPRRW